MEFFIYPTDNKYTTILKDVVVHLKEDHYYDRDEVTYVHEGTHGINAELRNQHRGFACFYMLNDLAIRLRRITEVTLTDLAREIPKDIRGGIYDLYLVEQARWWNDSPLYVCDEWTAYLNGTRHGCAINNPQRYNYSMKCTRELFGYMEVLGDMIDDDSYDEFLDYARHKTWFVEEHEIPSES